MPAWAIPHSVSGAEIVFFVVSGLAVGIVAGGVQPRLLYVSGRSPYFVPTPWHTFTASLSFHEQHHINTGVQGSL